MKITSTDIYRALQNERIFLVGVLEVLDREISSLRISAEHMAKSPIQIERQIGNSNLNSVRNIELAAMAISAHLSGESYEDFLPEV